MHSWIFCNSTTCPHPSQSPQFHCPKIPVQVYVSRKFSRNIFFSFVTCYNSCFQFVPKQFQCLALALSQICTWTKHKIVTLHHYVDTFTGRMAIIQHFIKYKGKIFHPTSLQNMHKMAIRACGIFN